ncbi:MAG: hypothetical protein GSR79_00435 [Desulfurococcales archaeon]|nr:hypothetical protein [Desulfurococcales archaeon]
MNSILDKILVKTFKYLPPEYLMFNYSRSLKLKVYSFNSLILHLVIKNMYKNLVPYKVKKLPKQDKILVTLKWKTLIILDAMRYDIFNNYISFLIKNFEKDKHKVISLVTVSPASNTPQWYGYYKLFLRKLTQEEGLILITFNPVPYVEKVHTFFFSVHNLWKDIWDEKMNAVSPDLALKSIMSIIFRNKLKNYKGRYLIHLLYPHAPYLVGQKAYTLQDFLKLSNSPQKLKFIMQKAYLSNTLHGILLLKKLLKIVPKPIIITADHGELLGEYNLFLHPGGLKIPFLRLVPLLIIT